MKVGDTIQMEAFVADHRPRVVAVAGLEVVGQGQGDLAPAQLVLQRIQLPVLGHVQPGTEGSRVATAQVIAQFGGHRGLGSIPIEIYRMRQPWIEGTKDGNGTADILWRHSVTGQNWMYLMNGNTIDSSLGVNTIPATWQAVNPN